MKTLIATLLARFKEPSSFAGLSLALTNVGIQLPNGYAEGISYILAGICAIASILISEKK
jgi:hypothetical protein